ncbi:MAG: WD40 repeat domain-containing protein [Bacteroidia bacterium]
MISPNFEKLIQLKGHTGSVYALEKGIAPHLFFSGGGDHLVVQWNLQTLDAGEVLVQASAIVYSLRLIASQNILLVGTSTGGVHVIDLNTRKELRLLQYHQQGIFDIQFSEKNNLLVLVAGDGVISFCKLNDLSLIKQIKLCDQKLRSAAFNKSENILAVGCGDGKVVLIEVENLTVLNSLQVHKENWSCNVVKFLSDTILLSGGRDAILNVIEIVNNEMRISENIAAHNYSIYDIQFSDDGKNLATASRDKSIKIWSTKDFRFIQKLDIEKGGHINSVNKILWSGYNNYIISGSDDRSLIVWESK